MDELAFQDTSFEVISKQKLSRNEEQVVFIKHGKDIAAI